MERTYSEIHPEYIAIANKALGLYSISWNIKEEDEGYSYYLAFVMHPTLNNIKNLILGWHNEQIDEKIISGFKWSDMPIWLSRENQFNYKAAYDLAVQTGGANLPVTFKFGTTDEPVYHTFTTLEELNSFYIGAMQYINDTLAEGWKEKDAIDWNAYTL